MQPSSSAGTSKLAPAAALGAVALVDVVARAAKFAQRLSSLRSSPPLLVAISLHAGGPPKSLGGGAGSGPGGIASLGSPTNAGLAAAAGAGAGAAAPKSDGKSSAVRPSPIRFVNTC